MFEFVTHLVTGSPVTYLVIAAVVAADAMVPLVPAETVVLTGGVLAAQDALSLALVVLAAAVGGMIGDNADYWLGSVSGRRLTRRIAHSERSRNVLGWARRNINGHPWPIILSARFVPGGRTATMLAAGLADLAWPRFVAVDATAVLLWAIYAAVLGFFGGAAFQHSLWKPLVVAFILAGLIGIAGAAVTRRHLRARPRVD